MASFNSDGEEDFRSEVASSKVALLIFLILPLLTIIQRLYVKYSSKMEPRIVFKLNWFLGNLLIFLTGLTNLTQQLRNTDNGKFTVFELTFICILVSEQRHVNFPKQSPDRYYEIVRQDFKKDLSFFENSKWSKDKKKYDFLELGCFEAFKN